MFETNELQTYFIRHTKELAISDDDMMRLWENHKIAIHYPQNKSGGMGNTSLDPDDYPSDAASVIRTFCELAERGGYVCADYYTQQRCLVGYVVPGSQIELEDATWEWHPKYVEYHNKPAVIKTLALQKVQHIEPSKQVSLLAGRPIKGTIRRWPSAKAKIMNIIEGITPERTLDNLHPSHLELICSEFLRLDVAPQYGLPILRHLYVRVGGTLKDIDIFAVGTDNINILAQVTHRTLEDPKTSEKLERLLVYDSAETKHLIFFCCTDHDQWRQGVHIFPVQTIFDYFNSSRPDQEWFAALL